MRCTIRSFGKTRCQESENSFIMPCILSQMPNKTRKSKAWFFCFYLFLFYFFFFNSSNNNDSFLYVAECTETRWNILVSVLMRRPKEIRAGFKVKCWCCAVIFIKQTKHGGKRGKTGDYGRPWEIFLWKYADSLSTWTCPGLSENVNSCRKSEQRKFWKTRKREKREKGKRKW